MKIEFFMNDKFFLSMSCCETRISFSILCFETRTRKRKLFIVVERENIKLILTRIPGIENSRYALTPTNEIELHLRDDHITIYGTLYDMELIIKKKLHK